MDDKGQYSNVFSKSEIGAQSAWKGFSTQTLYIANRIVKDTEGYFFYPEDIEDLVIKHETKVIEAVQIKNITANLSLSSLVSTSSSKSGEGFVNRVCSLHNTYPDFNVVRVVHFNELGNELENLCKGDEFTKKSIIKKLTENHNLNQENAEWLVGSLVFEKVSVCEMEKGITEQISQYVEVMAAPDIAHTLLIQYVFELSNSKGYTSLEDWKRRMSQIGTDIATIDGYYKEYGKSLIRLHDLSYAKEQGDLKLEFEQGVSAHPSHIRANVDIERTEWIHKISMALEKSKTVVVKGVSGQGKSALCYRYLLNNFSEKFVFCVRTIDSREQAQNLVVALQGIAKYTKDMIVYLEVNSGELQWIFLIQEMQARGLDIPVLVSIRDEDYNMTTIDGSAVNISIVKLELSKAEAEIFYKEYTKKSAHSQFRSFDEVWCKFRDGCPLIEFAYLLSNNQTLKQRLQSQSEQLLKERMPDAWILLLQIVSFAGKIGCSLNILLLKKELECDTILSAIQRFSDEYLIKTSDDGNFIETLHPIRAQILHDILEKINGGNNDILLLSSIKSVDSRYVQLLLMNYFTENSYTSQVVDKISAITYTDWIAYASVIKTMLWLDVKQYIEINQHIFDGLIKEHARYWFVFMPLDISGMIRPNNIIAEGLQTFQGRDKENLLATTKKVKESLSSMQIDYKIIDSFIKKSAPPKTIPSNDQEWSLFGYSLFWLALRGRKIKVIFSKDEISSNMITGDIQSKADAVRGMIEQFGNDKKCRLAINTLLSRIAQDYCIINFSVLDDEVKCDFVPPLLNAESVSEHEKNQNHYWKIRMLNILEQLFPDTEYISIELLGVELLRELGIKAVDHKIHIPKENRVNNWVTELNSWMQPRIDYGRRPETWNDYVAQIDEVRHCSVQLIISMISLIDKLYKKGVLDKKYTDKVLENIQAFNTLYSVDMLLPRAIADPYCLFGECSNKQEDDKFETSMKTLSYDEYKNFKKYFSDSYRQLNNFLNQFTPILIARCNRKNLTEINNPRLSLVNLVWAAKALVKMQTEYTRLFDVYGNIDCEFVQDEIDNFMMLVNMWAHVFENPIRGNSIAYDAKQRYRKTINYVDDALCKSLESLGASMSAINDKNYIMIPLEPSMGKTIKEEYTKIILNLREHLKLAQSFASERWYIEAYDKGLVYVPLYNGIPLSTGFLLPIYMILDTPIEEELLTLFPEVLPPELYKILDIKNESLLLWDGIISDLGTLKILITQYNDVLQNINEDKYNETGICQYVTNFLKNFSTHSVKLPENIPYLINILQTLDNELVSGLNELLLTFLEEREVITAKASKVQQIEGIEDMINAIITGLLLLKSEVI